MKSRQRVRLALNHEEPDRVPIDLGATIVTSIAKKAYLGLKQRLGIFENVQPGQDLGGQVAHFVHIQAILVAFTLEN